MTDQPNEIEQVKALDLSPAMKARESTPKKTWFFERGDGKLIICEEREAWDIVNNRSEWKRHDFKLVGVSDGTTFQRIVKESIANAQRLEPEINKLEAELTRYEKAEDKLVVEEAVDMEGDPSDTVNEANKLKVLRLKKIIARLEEQLNAKQKEYREVVSDVVKRATDAEFAVAKGHIEWPTDMHIITPDADPRQRQKILKLMNGS